MDIRNYIKLDEKEKDKLDNEKKIHQEILKKYKIRDEYGGVYCEESIIGGEVLKIPILETYLYFFTFPASFKSSFEMIDKYFPVLIKEADKRNYRARMTKTSMIESANNLKKWWFGFLQGKMQEDESFKSL